MSPTRPLRVLVIDDSAFSRRTIAQILERSPLVEVVDVARDGEEALRKALTLELDLITLDLEMPRMDGFTLLRLLMARRPTPVLVVSGLGGKDDVWKALELGAVDFVTKPTRRAAPELATIEEELLRKVLAVRELRIDRVRERLRHPLAVSHASSESAPRSVAIGASTGGPAALLQLFGAIAEPGGCAYLVAQHMPPGFTRSFAERIARTTPFAAREAESGMTPESGHVLVAPGGSHLELEARGGQVVARVVPAAPSDRYAPSVDRLFASAAKCYGPDLLAVVLTGMGDDGALGALAVKRAGGNVIAESEQTAVVYGMPRQAVRSGAVDALLALHAIPEAIQNGFARELAKRGVTGHE